MKAALLEGPVAVGVEANKRCFKYYWQGIMDDESCGTTQNHAVLTVGWGNDGGKDYWLVKNSWGLGWGDNGYIKIAIVDGAGICGIQVLPTTVECN